MYTRRYWLQKLREAGFLLKRAHGGHARYTCYTINIDVPIHLREFPPKVVANLKRAIRLTGDRAQ